EGHELHEFTRMAEARVPTTDGRMNSDSATDDAPLVGSGCIDYRFPIHFQPDRIGPEADLRRWETSNVARSSSSRAPARYCTHDEKMRQANLRRLNFAQVLCERHATAHPLAFPP